MTPSHLEVPPQVPDPSQTSFLVVSSPSLQAVPACFGVGALQVPMAGLQLLASRQSVAAGQVIPAHFGVPLHEPAPSHASFLVVLFPSSQRVAVDLGERVLQVPVVGMQLLASRQSVAEGQVTPAHLGGCVQVPSPSHRSCVVASPSSVQGVPAAFGVGMLHPPVFETQVLASKQSVVGEQVTPAHLEVPVQVPVPSHRSFLVVSSPSSQGVAAAEATRSLHCPVSGMHTPASMQSVASQLTSAHLDGCVHAPEPSHTSKVDVLPSSVQEVAAGTGF